MFKRDRQQAMDSSFLPEDYVAKKAERRTNVLAVVLFVIVSFGVIGAFFVTNREWNDVRNYQSTVNVRYAQAAQDIERLKQIEKDRAARIQKAEITTALIEKVPRSILLAELINRAPSRMMLFRLEVESEQVSGGRKASRTKTTSSGTLSASKKSSTSKNAAPPAPEVVAPKFSTSIGILAVCPENEDVAVYLRRLQECELLQNVQLVFVEQRTVKEREMVKFKIEADLRPNADARSIEPLESLRLDGDDSASNDVEEDA